MDYKKSDEPKPTENKRKLSKNNRQRDECLTKKSEQIPTDMSDSSDSDQSKSIPFVSTTECTSLHEGRQLVHTILPIKIDVLFDMLFSKSKFLQDFHLGRKSTDIVHGSWTANDDGIKTRNVNLTIALTGIGPKSSNVTETQCMRECSKPGELYSIDIHSTNAGIPYADSFEVLLHYCLVKTVDDHTMLSVHAQIKYKKSIWGPVKGFIEKNTWAGLEDFYTSLLRALQNEYCIPPAKAKGRRRPKRGLASLSKVNEDVISSSIGSDAVITQPFQTAKVPTNQYKWISIFVILLLIMLFIFNMILLLRLHRLEKTEIVLRNENIPNFSTIKSLPNNHDDWIKLLKQQQLLHETEMQKWHKILETAVELLKKVNNVCQALIKNDNFNDRSRATSKEL